MENATFETPEMEDATESERLLSDQIKSAQLEPENFHASKSRFIKWLKIFCLFIHSVTIIVYVASIICFTLGENAQQPTSSNHPIIVLKTGFKTLDCICIRYKIMRCSHN